MIIPSKRASHTSSMVTLSALKEIAIFCDFLGSSTLFSVFGEGRTERGVVSFGFEFGVFTTNNVSIISSFNLKPTQFYKLPQQLTTIKENENQNRKQKQKN